MSENIQPQDLYFLIRDLLADDRSDDALLDALQALARASWFPTFSYLYGPSLYQRNRTLFRPLLLTHLDASSFGPDGLAYNPWQGPEASEMQSWLDAADEADDAEMFSALYAWRAQTLTPDERSAQWRADLLARFASAQHQSQRITVLAKWSSAQRLDEATCVALYQVDPVCSPNFLRQHLTIAPEPLAYWAELSSIVRKQGDTSLFFAIYRRTVEHEQWARDVELLAERIVKSEPLIEQLVLRHPDSVRPNVSSVLYMLLRKRGEAVLPYALRILEHSAHGLNAEPARLSDLIRLADDNGWLLLWSSLIRATGRASEFDREVRRIVDDRRRDVDALVDRLRVLAGANRSNTLVDIGGKRPSLSDETATRLFQRFPKLLRRLFRSHLKIGPTGYASLTAAVVAAQDDLMSDYLASLVACVDFKSEWARREVSPMIDHLSVGYEAMQEDAGRFAQRASRVLGFISPGLAPRSGFRGLMHGNRLAVLFFGRDPATYLANASAVTDLIESLEVHTQHLGFRALAASDPRARAQAKGNIPLLQASLLQRMPRRVRRSAFSAIENAAWEVDDAAKLVPGIRQALELTDRGYPREDLIALLGRLLHRHPSLRTENEHSPCWEAST